MPQKPAKPFASTLRTYTKVRKRYVFDIRLEVKLLWLIGCERTSNQVNRGKTSDYKRFISTEHSELSLIVTLRISSGAKTDETRSDNDTTVR